jgi:signal transduction histidine kinase
MDYSRPLEAKPAPTNLRAVIGDVARTLQSDREDKGIQFDLEGPELSVEADESLLRQVVFNLLLNSIQFVPQNGLIAVQIEKDQHNEVAVSFADNGPGVPEEARNEIYRPYFTTSAAGTGLGLAVVRQIVLAQHWEIEYIPGKEGGAVFRISGIRAI